MRTLNLIFGANGLIAGVGVGVYLPTIEALGGLVPVLGFGLLGCAAWLNGLHLLHVGLHGSDRAQFTA